MGARVRNFLFLTFLICLHLSAKGDDSLHIALKHAKGANRASILNELARLERGNNADKALGYAEEALLISKKIWDQAQIAESNSNLGGVFYFKGDYHTAIRYFREALLMYRLLRNVQKEADMYNNLGVMYRNLGDLDKALDYYFQALKLKQDFADPLDKTSTLNNIGGIFYHQKNYKKAKEYYEKVLSVAIESDNRSLQAAGYNNLSLVAMDQGDLTLAESYGMKAMELRKQEGNLHHMAVVLSNLGRIYMAANEYDKAVHSLLQSLEKYKEAGDESSEALVLMQVGRAYYESGRYSIAEGFLRSGLDKAIELGSPVLERDCHYNLALALNKLGRTSEAFGFLESFILLNDSLSSEESINRIAEMEAQFQSAEKEKEIELLKRQNMIKELDNARKQEQIGRQTITQYSLSAGIFLVFVITGLIFRGYRTKQKANQDLEARNEAILIKNQEIEYKNTELALKNKEITDSIKYALRIQEAILPPDEFIHKLFPQSFVFYQPKDIVSGDFYWAEQRGDHSLIAAVDCTGHGVPGAFMSLVGHNLLKQAVIEHGLVKPGLILNELNRNLAGTLKRRQSESVKDGMDLALCSYCHTTGTLEYAGAYNPMYLVRNGELAVVKADKFPVGDPDETRAFNTYSTQVKKGDVCYLFSDGFADQFGGPSGKKFKYAQLQKMLLNIASLPVTEMHRQVQQVFQDWKGNMEQVDDVLLIGIRF